MEDFEIPKIQDLYTADYSNSTEILSIKEYGDQYYEIPLPKTPPKRSMVNFGKKYENTKFVREVLPDVSQWDYHQKEAFAKVMHHKRWNGEWQIIKGEPRYINGWAWEYYNFWTTESGGLPDFRWEGIEFYTLFDWVWRHPKFYGMFDVKARRMGDTDKSCHLSASMASRYRNAWSGLMNKNEDDAAENFERVVEGVNNLPWFFKPIMPSSSRPKKVMYFDYPKKIYSRKKLKEASKKGEQGQADDAYMHPALKSRVDYRSTVLGAYDGKRLTLYYLDEPGKITAFDVNDQLGIIRPALSFYNGSKIVGFIMFTSTVEDIESAETLENMKKLWDRSNPNELNKNGTTVTGLVRVFRDATLSYEPDEFGFPQRELAIEKITNEKESLEKVGDYDGLIKMMRKTPLTIDDVFKPSYDDCILYPLLLDKRISQIEKDELPNGDKIDQYGKPVTQKEIRGNLVWSNGFGSDVRWHPTPNGKWYISQHPIAPNKRRYDGNIPIPANRAYYTMGVDPVDHKIDAELAKKANRGDESNHSRSLAAIAIFRRYDPEIDGALPRGENGEISEEQVYKMETDQYVCDYLYRPSNPYEFYEDALKTAIYYGVPMLSENQKPGVRNYFENKGYRAYIQGRPKALKTSARSKAKNVDANTQSINFYVDALQVHIFNRIDTYHHTRILNCHRQFNFSNRGKRDLTVACGFAQLANKDNIKKVAKHRKRFDNLFNRYKRPST